MRRLVVILLAATALLGACSSSGGSGPTSSPSSAIAAPSTTDLGGGGGETSPPPSSTTPPRSTPRSTPTRTGPVRELPGPCPYITADAARAGEGDRVGNVFRLSTTPVGCRFYFAYDDTAIVLEITFRRFATTDAALNSLIAVTKAHPEFVTDKDIGAGAVSVRADLQGTPTWQCSFVKGSYVVTVHTRQPDPSYNARSLARQIEPRVP